MGENKLMKTSKLINYLIKNVYEKQFYVSMPSLHMSFGSDNIENLIFVQTTLNETTPLIIKSFTKIDSPVPFHNNKKKFIPMKLIIGGYIDKNNAYFLAPNELKLSYETCSKSGKKLPEFEDHSYVKPEVLLGNL